MRDITKLIVHCSATPNNRDITVEQITQWHLEKGWSDIGYHYVIYRDGSLHNGRPVAKEGAHVKGHNADSIGVCLIGYDKFTKEQYTTLKNLYVTLDNIYQSLEVYGHRDFTDKKTCPNFEIRDILRG